MTYMILKLFPVFYIAPLNTNIYIYIYIYLQLFYICICRGGTLSDLKFLRKMASAGISKISLARSLVKELRLHNREVGYYSSLLCTAKT